MLADALLFTVDGLRYDRLSSTGYDRATTPTIDALADRGTNCGRTMATGPATRMSFPGILASSYPLMYGGYAQLTEHRELISETFGDRGFTTVGVNTNAQLHSRFGWNRGFDAYYDSERTVFGDDSPIQRGTDNGTADEDESKLNSLVNNLKSRVYDTLDQDGLAYQTIESLYRKVGSRSLPHPSADEAVNRALTLVDRVPQDDRLFLWVHFMEPHSPYLPPEDYRERFVSADLTVGEIWRLNDKLHTNEEDLTDREVGLISDLYDASLRYVDDEIGRLINGLRERGRWDDAAMVLCGDHGEEFREHGGMTHGSKPYQEVVHVPLITNIGIERSDTPTGLTSTIDIAPTLLDATHDNPEIPEKYHGTSLCPVLRGGETLSEERAVFSQIASGGWRKIDLSNRITGCRVDDWKLITTAHPDEDDELYDLAADPFEQTDLATEESEMLDNLYERVEDHYAQDAYELYDIKRAISPNRVSDRLEALGYVE